MYINMGMNITYMLDPNTVSNTYFYLPIMIILALSPFFIWLISIFIVKNPKTKLVLDIFNLVYSMLLMMVILPSFLLYFISQIYQIIEYIGNVNIAMQLYNQIYILTTIYQILSLISPIYYTFGILVLLIDLVMASLPYHGESKLW